MNEQEIKDLSSIPLTQDNISALMYHTPDLVKIRFNAMNSLDLDGCIALFTLLDSLLDSVSKFFDKNTILSLVNGMIHNLVDQNHVHDQQQWRQDLCAIWLLRYFAKHKFSIDTCAEGIALKEKIKRIWESHLERYVDQSYDTLLCYEHCFYNAFEHYFNELEHPYKPFLENRDSAYKANNDVYNWLSSNTSMNIYQSVAKLNEDFNDKAEKYFNDTCICIQKLEAHG
ncbi:MAG: hypothetical protein K2X94_05325 [Amoebophilaceae bacterium]|nr:hypothetical protein [Amoebophilaceae bacterium]